MDIREDLTPMLRSHQPRTVEKVQDASGRELPFTFQDPPPHSHSQQEGSSIYMAGNFLLDHHMNHFANNSNIGSTNHMDFSASAVMLREWRHFTEYQIW